MLNSMGYPEYLYIYIMMNIVITNKLRIIQHTVNYLIKDSFHQNFIVGSLRGYFNEIIFNRCESIIY